MPKQPYVLPDVKVIQGDTVVLNIKARGRGDVNNPNPPDPWPLDDVLELIFTIWRYEPSNIHLQKGMRIDPLSSPPQIDVDAGVTPMDLPTGKMRYALSAGETGALGTGFYQYSLYARFPTYSTFFIEGAKLEVLPSVTGLKICP